jgi:hypothetical protein
VLVSIVRWAALIELLPYLFQEYSARSQECDSMAL